MWRSERSVPAFQRSSFQAFQRSSTHFFTLLEWNAAKKQSAHFKYCNSGFNPNIAYGTWNAGFYNIWQPCRPNARNAARNAAFRLSRIGSFYPAPFISSSFSLALFFLVKTRKRRKLRNYKNVDMNETPINQKASK